jgi:hypothetical protein
MKIMILVTAIMLSFSAFASMEEKLFYSQVNENKTYFETLGDMFEAGTKPEIKDMIKLAWSGRCFLADNQDAPTNAGLMFREVALPDAGPIGNGIKKYEGSSYWSRNLAADYYDNLTVEQIQKLHKLSYYAVAVDGVEAVLKFDKTVSQLRMSGAYIIERLSEPDSAGGMKNFARCYYFKSNTL